MLTDKIVIRNHKEELLDVLTSGNENAKTAIIFVHGFGSNKDENFNLFIDIATSLENVIIFLVLFSFLCFFFGTGDN